MQAWVTAALAGLLHVFLTHYPRLNIRPMVMALDMSMAFSCKESKTVIRLKSRTTGSDMGATGNFQGRKYCTLSSSAARSIPLITEADGSAWYGLTPKRSWPWLTTI